MKNEPGRTPRAFFLRRSIASLSEEEDEDEGDGSRRRGRIGDGNESESLSERTRIGLFTERLV